MARRAAPAPLRAALLLLSLAAASAAAPRRALLQQTTPCGGLPPPSPNKRGIRLALTPDSTQAYGARHITIANIDLNNPAYNGDEAAAAKMVRAFFARRPSPARRCYCRLHADRGGARGAAPRRAPPRAHPLPLPPSLTPPPLRSRPTSRPPLPLPPSLTPLPLRSARSAASARSSPRSRRRRS
jgi:hypothetical protein